MPTLSVISPVYNEAEVIAEFHDRLTEALAPLADRYTLDILYVVDRGTDRTLEILKEIAARDPRVRLLALSARFGHQMSLVAGMDHCDADASVMLDCDLQHPPELISALVAEFERGADIVYTVRTDAAGTGLFKRLTSRLFYKFVNTLSHIPIQESAADYRLVSRRVAAVFKTQIRERNQFLRGLFGWVGFRRIGIPFEVQRRAGGHSKYSLRRLVRFAFEGITSFSRRPLQAAIIVGFLFALGGLALAAITISQYFLLAKLPPGWATLVIALAVFNGIQLIFLGIIGEYIGSIFDEVKGRPLYIVDEKINFPET
ncbi:MAG: glycosyltransferase family 2 protein [Dongiaceae bacterium]